VRIFKCGAVVGEVFGGGNDSSSLETLDGGGAHEGDEGRVVPVGAAPDGGPRSRIYHGREVRIHAPAFELAPYLLGYSASFLWIRPAPDLRRRGLLRYPRGAPYLPTLVVHRDEQRDGGFRLHGEALQRIRERLRLLLRLQVVAQEQDAADVPLPDHLLDVVVRLRAVHTHHEHLPHSVPQAQPARHLLCRLPILCLGLLFRLSRVPGHLSPTPGECDEDHERAEGDGDRKG
jgi:hypothetical protein